MNDKTLSIIIKAQDQASKVMAGVSDKLDEVGKKMSDVGKKMSVAMTLPIVAGFGLAIKAASDLNETMNKVDVAFADQAKNVKDWSKTSIQSMGLAQQSALDAASLFGDMSTSMGLSTEESAKMSKGLTQLGGDMASFKNIQFSEAQTALAGVFTGETESLKRLGIVMTEVNLLEFAKKQGITKTMAEMTQSEKVQLRYAYIMSVTANAQGDFARTSEGAANQTRMTGERAKQLAADLGEKLLPAYGWLLAQGNKVLDWFNTMSPAQQKIALTTLAVVAAIGPLVMVLGYLSSGISVVTAAVKVLWVTMAANPIFLLVAALAGLVVGFGFLISQSNAGTASTRLLTQAQKDLKLATDELTLASDTLAGAKLTTTRAQLEEIRLTQALEEAIKKFGPTSLEAKNAANELAVSHNSVTSAIQSEATALQVYTDKEKNKNTKEIIASNDEIGASARRAASGYDLMGQKINDAVSAAKKAQSGSSGIPQATNAIFGIGSRAAGGPVSANQPYVVGENSDGSLNNTSELFVPKSAGTIINSKSLQAALGSMGGSSTFQMYGNINLGSQGAVDRFFERIDSQKELGAYGVGI